MVPLGKFAKFGDGRQRGVDARFGNSIIFCDCHTFISEI